MFIFDLLFIFKNIKRKFNIFLNMVKLIKKELKKGLIFFVFCIIKFLYFCKNLINKLKSYYFCGL